MNLFLLASLAVSSVLAARETVQDAASSARRLLRTESVLTLNSIFEAEVDPSLAGQPFSLPEYYADCSVDGNPVLLLMDIGMSMRNFIHGSPLSVSIGTTPPKGVYSAVSLPRMNLNGRVARITDREEEHDAKECYLSRHPDACEWTPDKRDAPHIARWYRFNVESVYYLGGSSNLKYT